jgi:hypothetical protein
MIQTGSLADAPQVGRLVRIDITGADAETAALRISWKFVRPHPDVSEEGRRLAARLAASNDEAEVESRERGWRKVLNRWIDFVPKYADGFTQARPLAGR